MDEEMATLYENQTWDLTTLPPVKHVVGCWQVSVVQFLPNGHVECLKARSVAKGYTKTFGVDYFETLSCDLFSFCTDLFVCGSGQAMVVISAGH